MKGRNVDEPKRNIRMLCGTHKTRPANLSGVKPESLIGTLVKKSFKADKGSGFGSESMWVEIESVTDDGVLVGWLANCPKVISELKFGSMVNVKMDEICDILDQK
jgi:uncharacterized protein YegJ (DUF2314 family)